MSRSLMRALLVLMSLPVMAVYSPLAAQNNLTLRQATQA